MKRRRAIAALLAILPLTASAGPAPWEACFIAAGQRYGINPLLLRAIARQESSMRPEAVGRNTNGTRDLGVMQINTSWLPRLARAGITERHLMDPCVNIHVGAWVLANAVKDHGMSWKAVGVYHSPTPWRQQQYAQKVQRHLLREIRDAAYRPSVMPAPQAAQGGSVAPVATAQTQAQAPAARPVSAWEAGTKAVVDTAGGAP